MYTYVCICMYIQTYTYIHTYVSNVCTYTQGQTIGDFGYGYFNGMLDEIRVWNQVRNRAQILIDMLDTPCGYMDGRPLFSKVILL